MKKLECLQISKFPRFKMILRSPTEKSFSGSNFCTEVWSPLLKKQPTYKAIPTRFHMDRTTRWKFFEPLGKFFLSFYDTYTAKFYRDEKYKDTFGGTIFSSHSFGWEIRIKKIKFHKKYFRKYYMQFTRCMLSHFHRKKMYLKCT